MRARSGFAANRCRWIGARRPGSTCQTASRLGQTALFARYTLTGHCYLSRGIYLNRAEFERWPRELQEGIQRAAREAIAAQRELAVEEEQTARKSIVIAGGEVLELTPEERAAFARLVKPLHDEARSRFGEAVFALL